MIKSLLLLFCCAALPALAQDTLAIITNPGTGQDNLTLPELQKVFRAEKAKAEDGKKFVVVMLGAGKPERECLLREVLKMSEADFTKYYLQATFTGLVAAAPKSLDSAAAMKAFVAATPGAIGYIRAADVDATVKVVKIDGAAPTDAGYKLNCGK